MTHTQRKWKFGNTSEGEKMILDENDRYVGSVQIHQTPRNMGLLDEDRRLDNAKRIVYTHQ